MRYEIIYLISASHEEDLAKIKQEAMSTITAYGGVFEEKEWYKKRKLSYEIKKEIQGIYIAQRFELEEKENIAKINKKLNLNSDILRFMISKADELPEIKTDEEKIKEEAKQKKDKLEREKTPEPKEKEEEKEEDKKEEKKPRKESPETKKEEDIDKQLEEILNI